MVFLCFVQISSQSFLTSNVSSDVAYCTAAIHIILKNEKIRIAQP